VIQLTGWLVHDPGLLCLYTYVDATHVCLDPPPSLQAEFRAAGLRVANGRGGGIEHRPRAESQAGPGTASSISLSRMAKPQVTGGQIG
jgi:hypothetical protein